MVKQMERRFSLRKVCHLPSVILYFAIAGQMAIGLAAANEVNLSQPEEKKTIKIGVVRLEDPYFYLDCFGPTMEFLREKHKDWKILTEEIPIETTAPELADKDFDFLISPSGFFEANLKEAGLRQIVTRMPEGSRNPSESVGATFVVREDSGFHKLEDLKGRRAVSYDKSALAGWLSAAYEIASKGFVPEKFFSSFHPTRYNLPSPLSYLARGSADVAILPTCEYERIIQNGQFMNVGFRVLDPRKSTLKCASSTNLYPDVVFSSFPKVEPDSAASITLSLLTMPEELMKSKWSIANDFRNVGQLFEKLKIGPYAKISLSPKELWDKYRTEILLSVMLLGCLIFHIVRVNSLVLKRTAELRMAINQRDEVAKIAKERLRKLNQIERKGMVSQMSSMIAHELKQPLSSVSNYVRGLRKYVNRQDSNDPIIHEAVNGIERGITRASNIVERVRGFAREQDKTEIRVISLKNVIEKAVASFEAYVSTSLKIKQNIPADVKIEADPLAIELLIFNLLKNAAEAVEPLGTEGAVSVSLILSVGKAEIKVEDNGEKIAPEKLQRMQKALQETVKANGAGLGLGIVFAIAEKYGGTVSFEQKEPNGLQVTVAFDAVQPT